MDQQTIQDVFKQYLEKPPIFNEKIMLTTAYKPETVPHREEQIRQIAKIVVPLLKGEKSSNIFIYGSVGTGKTLVVDFVSKELMSMAEETKSNLTILYVNSKMKRVADTEYRLLAHLSKLLGKNVPATGLPTDQVYKIFFEALKEKKGPILIIVDEIDALIKKVGDELLYNLTRINTSSNDINITFIGISNDLSFIDFLDARVRSSLSEEELIFPPYNAMQLKDLLAERAKKAFTKDTLTEGVIEKCAALAAQEHGDARRALDLLRVAGELADRNGETKVTQAHVDKAQSKIDADRILEAIKNQPKQAKLILHSILSLKEKTAIATGDVYDVYACLCKTKGFSLLTQRRVSDIISELDLLGIINAKVISKGRYGRTREIKLDFSEKMLSVVDEFMVNDLCI